jgi:hypothetical protein
MLDAPAAVPNAAYAAANFAHCDASPEQRNVAAPAYLIGHAICTAARSFFDFVQNRTLSGVGLEHRTNLAQRPKRRGGVSLGPDVVAGQTDVLPSEGCDMGQKVLSKRFASMACQASQSGDCRDKPPIKLQGEYVILGRQKLRPLLIHCFGVSSEHSLSMPELKPFGLPWRLLGALQGMDAYGNHDGCDRMAWRQVDLLLRFAIASAFLSNVSSAIFCARLTSPVANPCNVRHHAKASSPSASSSWILKTCPR